ncbi:MAG: hypothetical protein R2710_30425 [Acidimicrobiales bacterium]
MSIGLGVVLFVVAGPFGRLVSDDAAGDLTSMLRVFAVVVPTWALTQALLGASRGLGTMGPTVGVGQVLRPGGQIVLLGLQFWRGDPSATAIAVAWSVPVLIGLGVAIVAVARLGGFQQHGPGLVTGREFWGYTRFRALSTTMQIALERIDVVIVKRAARLRPGRHLRIAQPLHQRRQLPDFLRGPGDVGPSPASDLEPEHGPGTTTPPAHDWLGGGTGLALLRRRRHQGRTARRTHQRSLRR